MAQNSIVSKNRKSGLDLLKIIAIILICLSHCTQRLGNFIDLKAPTTNTFYLVCKLLFLFGQIGNILFVCCSSYFLLDSNRSKKEKAINILMDSQLIAIVYLASYIISFAHFKIPLDTSPYFIIINIFPDLYDSMWFVPAYVILYLSHPYLNRIIAFMGQRRLFIICFIIVVFYAFTGLFGGAPQYSTMFGFFMLYFIIAYFKFYLSDFMKNIKANLILSFVSFSALIAVILVKNYLSFFSELFNTYPDIIEFISMTLTPMCIFIFNVFLNIDFKNKIISSLSSCTLFVYLIHENYIVREKYTPIVYRSLFDKFGKENIALCLLIFFVFLTIVSFIAAIIYNKTIHKLTQKLSVKAHAFVSKLIDKLMQMVHKKDIKN